MASQDLPRLTQLGFEQAGRFYVEDNVLKMKLINHKQSTGCYAFVKEGEVLYVGITTNAFYARMNGYKNPS